MTADRTGRKSQLKRPGQPDGGGRRKFGLSLFRPHGNSILQSRVVSILKLSFKAGVLIKKFHFKGSLF